MHIMHIYYPIVKTNDMKIFMVSPLYFRNESKMLYQP